MSQCGFDASALYLVHRDDNNAIGCATIGNEGTDGADSGLN